MTNVELRAKSMAHGKEITSSIIEMAKTMEPVEFEMAEITVGSEKQIGWASTIQIQKAQKAVTFYQSSISKVPTESKAQFISEITNYLSKVFSHNDARYWIDNQSKDIYAMMEEAAK